jgi:4-hydroxybenzoate polyprenyltransferase
VAFLLSFSVLIIGLFDLLPATYDGNRAEMGILFSMLIDYAIFAFIINFIREIVKDMEDVNGDYNQGMSTLPIAIGVKRTSTVVFVLGIISILILLWYINSYLMSNNLYFAVIYSLLFVVAPLILFVTKIWNSTEKKGLHFLSTLLKWIIFFGILSVLVITLNIKYHVKG